MKLLVKDIIKETNDAVSVSFKNGGLFNKLKYKPGQFLTIHVPIENQIYKRAYSFSSNPYTDKDLKITIKRVEDGLVSNFVHDNLKVGDKIRIDNPSGSFYIQPNSKKSKQYVLFAGGSGITPIYSILKSVLTNEPNSKVLLVYANQTIESIIFHSELHKLEKEYPNNLFIEYIISADNTDTEKYNTGFLTKELLDAIFKKHELEYANYDYMICGPSGYMDKAKEILTQNGIAKEKIKLEVFKAPEADIENKDLVSEVTIKHKGNEQTLNVKGDKTILQQAMSSKVAIPYSCRSGMCSTCKGKCVEGKVKMLDGHFLSEDEVNAGNILTCISYPLTEKVTIEL